MTPLASLRRASLLWPSLCALALAGLGCGRAPHTLQVDGILGRPVMATGLGGLFDVPAQVNGVAGAALVVDTGAPLTFVSPTRYAAAGLVAGREARVALTLGDVTLREVPVLAADIINLEGVGGLLGGNVICQFVSTFDYRTRSFVIGEYVAPQGVEQPGVDVPVRIEGGGLAQAPGISGTVSFPATRVTLDVVIEGTTRPMVLDTGASGVVLRSSVLSQVTADGRATATIGIVTVSGPGVARATRLRSVIVAGAEVTAAPAFDFGDEVLASLAREVGHPVDGLLGATFLQEFLVTLDYARGRLRLQRYADRAHITDQFRRIGIELAARPAGAEREYAITRVLAGDATAQGLRVDDVVRTIDGQVLSAVGGAAVERLLRGDVGATRTLVLGDGRTVTVRVEEQLPL